MLLNWGQTHQMWEEKNSLAFFCFRQGFDRENETETRWRFHNFFSFVIFAVALQRRFHRVFWIAFCDVVGRADWLTAHICLIAVVWSVGGVSG